MVTGERYRRNNLKVELKLHPAPVDHHDDDPQGHGGMSDCADVGARQQGEEQDARHVPRRARKTKDGSAADGLDMLKGERHPAICGARHPFRPQGRPGVPGAVRRGWWWPAAAPRAPPEGHLAPSSVLSPDAWTARTSWRLEVLGQYWANISVQSRRHVALPGRSLEFGRRFFRSF